MQRSSRKWLARGQWWSSWEDEGGLPRDCAARLPRRGTGRRAGDVANPRGAAREYRQSARGAARARCSSGGLPILSGRASGVSDVSGAPSCAAAGKPSSAIARKATLILPRTPPLSPR
jgi:hypothetical protein